VDNPVARGELFFILTRDFKYFCFRIGTCYLDVHKSVPQARGRFPIGEGPAEIEGAVLGGWFSPLTSLERLADMATGKVKWFNDQKGFGFISADTDAKDVFVHHSVIEGQGFRTLQDGETVEYEAEDGPKGIKATRVKRMAPVAAH
jgi:CspA family cold shock protein